MFIQQGMYFTQIARELNRRHVKYIEGSEWDGRAVKEILTHPKYIGWNVYGQYTQKLYTAPKKKPRSEWTINQGAFEPVVDTETFAKAQLIMEKTTNAQPRNKSDKELLDALRKIRYEHGRITTGLIKTSGTTQSEWIYKSRFRTVSHAYE